MAGISSRVTTVGDLFMSGRYEPARAQREYCWEEKQILTLLEDLTSAFSEFGNDPESASSEPPAGPDETTSDQTETGLELPPSDPELEQSTAIYFLGTIVVQPLPHTTAIYDGLQRFTTLLVLFCVLRDLSPAHFAEMEKLIRENGCARLSMPMKHKTLDADVIAAGRTTATYAKLAGLTPQGAKIRDAVYIIREWLSDWSEPRLRAFGAFVRDSVQVSILTISDRRLAGKAFATINATGVPLKDEEIVKGQLIELTAEAANPEQAENEILNIWNAFQTTFGAEFKYFLRAVDFLERRMPQGPDHAIQLMEHISRRYRGEEGYKWVTQRLPLYAGAYKWLSEANTVEVASKEHAPLRRLSLLPWDEWKAMAMLIKIKTRAPDLSSRLTLLDKQCFIMSLALDQRPRAMMLGRAIERYAPRGRRFPPNAGLQLSASVLQKARRTLERALPAGIKQNTVLRWIEAAHHGAQVPIYVCRNRGSVEHVFPKNPDNNWPAFAVETANEQLVLQQSLGNLCLLPDDKLGNAAFNKKRDAYKRAKGYLFATQISKSSEWTPTAVRARTRSIVDFASGLLELPAA
ncbi:MAG: DUF262 domain-containing protein [Hyphomonadaceae bacterium]|nr:DUF262 domain-containing protein [Hyphomonadaceae bacterium]